MLKIPKREPKTTNEEIMSMVRFFKAVEILVLVILTFIIKNIAIIAKNISQTIINIGCMIIVFIISYLNLIDLEPLWRLFKGRFLSFRYR